MGSWALPEWLVPESATNIREMHDIDTSYAWVRFEFEASDAPDTSRDVRKLQTEELRGVEVPEAPYGGRKWWDLPEKGLASVADNPGVDVYEVRVRETFASSKERLGYLVVDRKEHVAHYFFGLYAE